MALVNMTKLYINALLAITGNMSKGDRYERLSGNTDQVIPIGK